MQVLFLFGTLELLGREGCHDFELRALVFGVSFGGSIGCFLESAVAGPHHWISKEHEGEVLNNPQSALLDLPRSQDEASGGSCRPTDLAERPDPDVRYSPRRQTRDSRQMRPSRALMSERMMRVTEDLFRKSIDGGYGRCFTVGQLVDGWAKQVHRLAAEARQPETEQTWGIDDFVGALHWRSIVAGAVTQLDPTEQEEVESALDPSDIMFKTLTRSDPNGAIQHVHQDIPAETGQWWWFRAPSAGLPAQEFTDRT